MAAALYGDALIPVEYLIQPLPVWAAAMTLVLFPVSIAMTELPIYFAYVRPRLERLVGRPWVAVTKPPACSRCSTQRCHLMFDGRFLVWRALMFAPLALMFGIVLRWRPRLLIYLVIVHFFADLQAGLGVWTASYG